MCIKSAKLDSQGFFLLVQTTGHGHSNVKTVNLRRKAQSDVVIHVNELMNGKMFIFELAVGCEEIAPINH